ncbi:hypothetical protein J2Z21_007203 [Streptomyces griseochromogenes]|uniref:Uncharacterized protein n=1 Tax=Streptomyces griseochromogenes TaxID=68214 RepID=A0A1B1AYM6_9ACTN|nr:DUF6193 family natural product biosynthesis protein [Streptomyces griseochromogenes]ANP51678.1 hypothetical protein AVL59_20620 [Streptomyces griseochromogenes]MBP2054200.1 hypothetical protein [Streptomyces griseochromogenes]
MEIIALAQGVDLRQLRPVSGGDVGAEMGTGRGKAIVSLHAEDTFRVRICLHGAFAWSEGWTNDLVAAVGVADLWCRGGRLRELHDRFPFMSWDELAQAFEDGDPVATKWRQLLSSDWHLRDRPLHEAAHVHPDLRVFYPDISMGSLMLSRKPFDLESGLVKIMPLSEEHYRVTMWPTAFRRDVTSLNEALDVAVACFRSLSDS